MTQSGHDPTLHGLLNEIDDHLRTTTPNKRRVWIGAGGVVLCDDHAEFFLRIAIDQSPDAAWHETPRGKWVGSHRPQLHCDTCTTLYPHTPATIRRPTDEAEHR